MAADFLHNHQAFPELLRIIEDETGILAGLVEKDYWIMHVLYGLSQAGYQFELKGGTSLSKGFRIIERFSEDIDIHIKPPAILGVNENPKNTKQAVATARKEFYDWLAGDIKIDGITSATRDIAFDEPTYYRSGGIRLHYSSHFPAIAGVKEGILLEAGFDTVTPNTKVTISSWAYDRAAATQGIELIDNRAVDIACYHPGYTLVEKLQTITNKFRKEQEGAEGRPNFMRQYYDVYCLLGNADVQNFIGTDAYKAHKTERFKGADAAIPVSENEAFKLTSPEIKAALKKRYEETGALYYKGQTDFEEILDRIGQYLDRL
ncbi:MAG: nucleotidyl transferase AbiEii/AbiGii toxin family protein [Bacteroidetes bacterium]|nr:nucleotidyl transferase AbiEii/AbiGii toxin family protein [Bacteroidota bacterium]